LRRRARLIATCRQAQRAGSAGDKEAATVGSREPFLLARGRPIDPAMPATHAEEDGLLVRRTQPKCDRCERAWLAARADGRRAAAVIDVGPVGLVLAGDAELEMLSVGFADRVTVNEMAARSCD
jgi:hypothetical protein